MAQLNLSLHVNKTRIAFSQDRTGNKLKNY